jgi:hypothetical protein
MTNKDQFEFSDQFPNNNNRSLGNDKESSKLESQDNTNSIKKGLNFWILGPLNYFLLKKDSNSSSSEDLNKGAAFLKGKSLDLSNPNKKENLSGAPEPLKKLSPDFQFKNGKKQLKVNSNNLSSPNKNAKGDVVSVTYEEIGLWPRSFSRVLDRFLKQVFSDVETLVIQEYRFYRYLFLTTVRCLSILFFVPFLVNFFLKNYLIHPLTEYFWNTQQSEIFLNSYQQKHAFAELKEFEEKLYFESFITTSHSSFGLSKIGIESPSINTNDNLKTSPSLSINSSTPFLESQKESYPLESILASGQSKLLPLRKAEPLLNSAEELKNVNENQILMPTIENKFDYNQFNQLNSGTYFIKSISSNPEGNFYKQKLQEKMVEIATRYNEQSIKAITNFFADLLSFLTLFYFIFQLEIQINITKSFLLEVFFGLEDSKKSLLILLITDLLVGYHSSNIWELFFEFLFHHYGLPESQTGIFLLVATLPVLLDVLFKYLIFRHLNRSSPATVATYHAMIE